MGLWAGAAEAGVLAMGSVLGEYSVSEAISLGAGIGLQRRFDGSLDLRDGSFDVTWRAVRTATAVVNVRPGITIPTGGLGDGFAFTPLSTASIDPRLSVDAALGAAWLVLPSATTRLPFYRGWDGRLQGPFVRADLRGARRLGDITPWVGVSAAHQAEGSHPRFTPSFSELATTAGAFWAIDNKWGLAAQTRIPLWVGGTAFKVYSGSVALRYVIRPKPKSEH